MPVRRLYLDRVSASGGPAVRGGYLRTTSDVEVGHALQTRSARELGATWIGDVPTGHLPQLEQPEVVTQALQRLIREIETAPH